MANIDKDKALLDWLQSNEGLKGTLLFNFLSEAPGSVAIIVAPESPQPKNIDGSVDRQYLFYLQVMRPLSQSTDDINTDSMVFMREWQEWIDTQELGGSYPDFGAGCSCYELSNLADNPQLAITYTDDQMAKYQFPALLTYLEVK